MGLEVFEYFWNTYYDFFKTNRCIDDYTWIYVTEKKLHFQTASHELEFSESIIEGFDKIIKELLGNVNKTVVKKPNSKEDREIIVEYQITKEMQDSICIMSKLNGYSIFDAYDE